jgi:P27 family predicted phage terminase small subunit
MAPRGRPPKPLEMHRRNGNPSKKKLPARSATVSLASATEVPPVPLSLGQVGRALWQDIWDGPAQVWLARDVDGIRITTVCRLADDIDLYRQLIDAMGPALEEPIITAAGVITGHLRVMANPVVKMLRDAEKGMDRELSALAFDPVSRSRLGLAEVKRQSIIEHLLRGTDVTGEAIEIASDDPVA